MYNNDMEDRKSSKGCVLDLANQIKQKSYEKQSNQILSFTMLYDAEARNELTGPIYTLLHSGNIAPSKKCRSGGEPLAPPTK